MKKSNFCLVILLVHDRYGFLCTGYSMSLPPEWGMMQEGKGNTA